MIWMTTSLSVPSLLRTLSGLLIWPYGGLSKVLNALSGLE